MPAITDILTQNELKILGLIHDYLTANGFSPTTMELAKRHGYNKESPLRYTLEKLEKKGYISIRRGRPNKISLLGVEMRPVYHGDAGKRLQRAIESIRHLNGQTDPSIRQAISRNLIEKRDG